MPYGGINLDEFLIERTVPQRSNVLVHRGSEIHSLLVEHCVLEISKYDGARDRALS